MGFWVFGSKIKNTGFSPPFAPFAANHTPGPSAGARARFFAAQNPGKLLCSHQVCCCFRFAVGPAGCFFCRRWTCRSSRSIAVEQAPRTARGGGAGPPVRLLSLTSFSAGDLVPRPCMSSSYGCASCRLCLLRHRVSSALVPSCPPPFLSSSTGSSHSSRSFCIQGATEVQDRQDQVNGHVGPFCLHLRPA